MVSPVKQSDEVVARVLKRVEVGKIARRLQSRLALARFKTKLGWEHITLDSIQLMLEEIGRKRLWEVRSDSSSSVSEPLCPTQTLTCSPLKAPHFSYAVSSSDSSAGHRKRTTIVSCEPTPSYPRERYCASPTARKCCSGHATWKDGRQMGRTSPIKLRRLPPFTTPVARDVSFEQRRMVNHLRSPNFATLSDDDDNLLVHSFIVNNMGPYPPRTPPMHPRSISSERSEDTFDERNQGRTGEEGADLLPYQAGSPFPVITTSRGSMECVSTPAPMSSKLDPPVMMATPGEGSLYPDTPGQSFDLADFVHVTPSPAQKQSRTAGHGIACTALRVARRLTFEGQLPP